MISQNALHKITTKSKNLKWEVSRYYHPTQDSIVPYGERIVKYGDKLFVIHENMIFKGGSVADSSYSVFEFDEDGDYIGIVELKDLPDDFFYQNEVIAEI